MNRDEMLDRIPAYVLGALDAEERAELEAWLPTDAEAQQLVAEYRQVAEALVLATPVRPAPAHLGEDLRRRLAERRASRPPAEEIVRLPRLWVTWAAVVVALLMIALGVILALTRQAAPSDPAQLFAYVAAQEGALHVSVTPGDDYPQIRGEMVVSPDGMQAVIRVAQLPELPPDQTFQLWLVEPEGVRSGGLFQAQQPETYIVLSLDRPVSDYRAFGVSIEPAGGSPFPDRPTGPRAFAVVLEA